MVHLDAERAGHLVLTTLTPMDENASALDTAAAIRAMDVSPLEILDACLAHVDARNPELNAVIWRNDEEARAEARTLGERIAVGIDGLPPFAGVPLPIKDLLPVAGQPVTYGSLGAPGRSERGERADRRRLHSGWLHPRPAAPTPPNSGRSR